MGISEISTRIQKTIKLLQSGHADTVRRELRKRLHSTATSFALKRDLSEPFRQPEAKIKIRIRPFHPDDLDYLLGHGLVQQIDPRLDSNQRSLAKSGLSQGYVAVTSEGHPCYMQWLISSDQNDQMLRYFKGVFAPLAEDEALLEGAYMQPNYTGLRIMPAAMSMISEKATELGARYVVTYVDVSNIPSLKGCHRSGYSPYRLRTDRWRFFRRTTQFSEIPDHLLEQYEIQMGIRTQQEETEKIPIPSPVS
jgi:hypothetical protein